jgi:hypothetical protein
LLDVKRIVFWLVPLVALTAVAGLLGYRLFARRTVVVRGGEGAATVGGVTDSRRPGRVTTRPRLVHLAGPPPVEALGGSPTAPPAIRHSEASKRKAAEAAAKAAVYKPQETKVRTLLEPLVKRRENTDLNFVVCTPYEKPQVEQGQEIDAFDAPPRDTSQPVCRARVQARDPVVLKDVLKDASAAYSGHVAVEVREHLDAYTGHWFEADLRVDTDEVQPLPTEL